MPSFDIVSEVNAQEVKNAVDQVRREIETRYDFKGKKVTIELNEKELLIILMADEKMRIAALQEITKQKLSKRGISLKSVTFEDEKPAGGDMIRQEVKVKQGLTDDEAKKITKLVKEMKVKVSPQIQANQVRVTGKKRDDLQEVIANLRKSVNDIELQYTNFRE